MDITQTFIVHSTPTEVFKAISTLGGPEGLDTWWSLNSSGIPGKGNKYKLNFGPGYDWIWMINIYDPDKALKSS